MKTDSEADLVTPPRRDPGRSALRWGLAATLFHVVFFGLLPLLSLLPAPAARRSLDIVFGIPFGVLLLLTLIAGPLAVSRGRRALRQGSPQRRAAIAGMLLGGVSFLVLIVGGTMAASRAKAKATQASCESNVKQLGLALTTYAVEHGDRLPDAAD